MQNPLIVRHHSTYESCAEVCGKPDHPGQALDNDEKIDFSCRDTTPDQRNIEGHLAGLDLSGKALLHVGVGNSKLAERFHGRLKLIDGLTVSTAEKKVADAMRIQNYSVYLLNKYGRRFVVTISNSYDIIVDNNLAGFACCKFHFYLMLDNYYWSLNHGGVILTDQRGMNWSVADPRWRLSYDDLVALEEKYPFRAERITDTVYLLRKTG